MQTKKVGLILLKRALFVHSDVIVILIKWLTLVISRTLRYNVIVPSYNSWSHIVLHMVHAPL